MIATLLSSLAIELSATATFANDDGNAPGWLLLLGPAGAGGVYFFAWRYYRNTHQSHGFEHETRIEAQPITGNDDKVRTITGTKKRSIDGDNRSNHRQRVQRY